MELKSTLQKEAEGGEAHATTASILSAYADASSDRGLEECLPYPVLSDTILSDLSLSFGFAKGQTCENDGIFLRDMLLCVWNSHVALSLSQIIPFLLYF